MSVIFNDPFEGDEESDILSVVRRGRHGMCKKAPRCYELKKHDCGIRPNRYPKRPKHIKYPGMPRIRTLELAVPKLIVVENNVARYHQTLEPRRVVRLVKLIHEIQEPKPQRHLWPPKKTRKLCCKRKTKLCSKETAAKEWLERQTTETAKLVMSYISKRGRLVPNYKQLNVAMQMMKQLHLKKRKDICKRGRAEIYNICEQFAILVDTKCEPYKRTLHIEPKSETTVASGDQKHCIFSLRKFADGYDSELSTEGEEEEEEEEEEEGGEVEEGVFEEPTEVQEEEEPAKIEEAESVVSMVEVASEVEEEEVRTDFGFDELLIAADEMESVVEQEKEEAEEAEDAEETDTEAGFGIPEDFRGMSEEEEGSFVEEIQFGVDKKMTEVSPEEEEMEGIIDEIDQFVEQLAEEILPAAAGYESEEEEPMGIAGDEEYEKHPRGTASFVAWCVYVSWLNEFGKNIEIYSHCLKTFKEIVQTGASPENNDIIVHILHNWADYLKDIMRVDQDMVLYFKEKPITRCDQCVECDIYSIPKDHELPEQLLEAVKTTIEWKTLLEEAEKGCRKLQDGLEEITSILSGETFEILEVCDSEASGFVVEEMPRMYTPPCQSSRPSQHSKREGESKK